MHGAKVKINRISFSERNGQKKYSVLDGHKNLPNFTIS